MFGRLLQNHYLSINKVMDEKKKQRLITVFQILSKAYQESGLSGLNAERVACLVRDIDAENGFFRSQPDEQSRRLNFMKEIHTGRGEMFYALEKKGGKGGVDPSFWMEFNIAIEDYLDDLIGKSYPFPEK